MPIPEFTPVSTMQRNYKSIVKKISDGPVILAQHTTPVAVVMLPATYEHLIGLEVELKRLQRMIKADRDFADMRAGNYTLLTDVLAENNADSSQ